MLKMCLAAVVLFVVRFAALLPFLDANGRLTLAPGSVHLPANVEYFFSMLLFVMTAGTLLASAWVFRNVAAADAMSTGLKAAACFVVVFVALDMVLEFTVAHRGLALWFRNVALDYSPLILVPVLCGWKLAR